MAFFGAAYWISPLTCLDAEFDAPDDVADHELCCAIAAGKAGLHPDAWGNHDPLPLRWLLRKRRDEPEPAGQVYHPSPADLRWEAQHRQRPPTESPIKRLTRAELRWIAEPPQPDLPAVPRKAGELQLTCDECRTRYGGTLLYYDGKREESVEAIRKLGAVTGWTCIEGRDLCPDCSVIPPRAKPRKQWRRLRLR